MDLVNLVRRVERLWKIKHTHDDENFQEQITLIRETVQSQRDDVTAITDAGAHIHLTRSAVQSIPSGGAAISWDTKYARIDPFNFADPPLPVTGVTILRAGYYNVAVQLGWSTYTGGGSVWVVRVRADDVIRVWPPAADPGLWTKTNGQFFEGTSPAIPCQAGDKITVYVDHDTASARELASATLAVYLVDRGSTGAVDDWELVFEADNYGVTWDGSSWWTTLGDKDNVNPALFERDTDGTILNSYDGYDQEAPARNRGIVFADGWLWGIGNEEKVHKINPSDGTVISTFTTYTTDPGDGRSDIGYNGSSLFLTENTTHDHIEEYTLAGAHVQNHSFPSGRLLRGLTWDGANWWSTLDGGSEIIRMNASFDETLSIPGPPSMGRGCHFRDEYLYVMTAGGLYRKVV